MVGFFLEWWFFSNDDGFSNDGRLPLKMGSCFAAMSWAMKVGIHFITEKMFELLTHC